MYEFIQNLDSKTYEKFVFNHNKKHFMQSIHYGEVQKIKDFKPYYVGMKKNNELVAAALLLEKKVFQKLGYIYIPRGFILDYSDFELLEQFTLRIKQFTKKTNNFFFRIDPDIPLRNIDDQANEIEGVNQFELVDYLKKIHYIHKGFNRNFEHTQPRYTFRLQLSNNIEDVFKGFHATTRKVLNKKNQYNLNIYKGNIDDVADFYKTMLETGERENLIQSKQNYYETFYNILHLVNMSNIYMIKVNIPTLIQKYNDKIEAIHKQIHKLENNKQKNPAKSKNLLADLDNQLKKATTELTEIETIQEEELVLSSIITVEYNNYIWTVHGGNSSQLRWLNANYLIYYEIIKDAVKNNFTMIDFFGTTGDPNPNNPIYGIYLFKKRLGGTYTEFIGEFDYVVNPFIYRAYHFLKKIKDK